MDGRVGGLNISVFLESRKKNLLKQRRLAGGLRLIWISLPTASNEALNNFKLLNLKAPETVFLFFTKSTSAFFEIRR